MREFSAFVHQIQGNADDAAAEVRDRVGLPITVGVARTKFLAKVASDWRKPDGMFTIAPDQVAEVAKPVNLSAGGMCAGVDEHYDAGTALEIRMLLFPSFTGLMIYGTVIDCSTQEHDPSAEKHHGALAGTGVSTLLGR